MAKGSNVIIVSTEPHGKFMEGIVAASNTFLPGMIVQIKPSVAAIGGRDTYEVYDRAADGDQPIGAFWVVLNDYMRGGAVTDSFAAGERCFLYAPLPGDELNLLLLNISGTGDDHAKGEILMVDDGTGKLIATTGSPETEVAVLRETVTDPIVDTLAWCQWSGH